MKWNELDAMDEMDEMDGREGKEREGKGREGKEWRQCNATHFVPFHSFIHSFIHTFIHSFHFMSCHFISFHFTSFRFISFHSLCVCVFVSVCGVDVFAGVQVCVYLLYSLWQPPKGRPTAEGCDSLRRSVPQANLPRPAGQVAVALLSSLLPDRLLYTTCSSCAGQEL